MMQTAWATEAGKRVWIVKKNNTKRESGKNVIEFLRLKCKHNGEKRVTNVRIDNICKGQKTRKNGGFSKSKAHFSPMET